MVCVSFRNLLFLKIVQTWKWTPLHNQIRQHPTMSTLNYLNALQFFQELSNVDITTFKMACWFAPRFFFPMVHWHIAFVNVHVLILEPAAMAMWWTIQFKLQYCLFLTHVCGQYNQNTLSKYIEEEYTFVSQELFVTLLHQSSQAVHTLHNTRLRTKGVNLLFKSIKIVMLLLGRMVQTARAALKFYVHFTFKIFLGITFPSNGTRWETIHNMRDQNRNVSGHFKKKPPESNYGTLVKYR